MNVLFLASLFLRLVVSGATEQTQTELVSSSGTLQNGTEINLHPVIGILTQETSQTTNRIRGGRYTSYIPANYVKFSESAGARVVPIMINKPEEYYRGIFNAINGIVFPGGSVPFSSHTSGYGRAGSILYNLIHEAAHAQNDHIPLFATCMGFQMLMYLDGRRYNPLSPCSASNMVDRLYLRPAYKDTELLGGAPPEILKTLTTTNSTANFHHNCVTPQRFEKLSLSRNFTLASTSFDQKGVEYVSTVEHKHLPLFGTQWHPEKNQFDWFHECVDHTEQAVRAAQYVINTFVQKARENSHRYQPAHADVYPLIYNYQTTYDGKSLKYLFQ